jgi:glyoxylase-like metal-dependent hydrolase (beta-lactamase superfamily II)
MGDTFFNGGYPFIDVSSDGSIDGIIAAAEAVLARSDAGTQIIPGHGPLGTPDDLRAYLDVVRRARERIQSLIDQGRSEEEVIAARPTAEWDAQWGAGFMNGETFTRLAYQSLSR